MPFHLPNIFNTLSVVERLSRGSETSRVPTVSRIVREGSLEKSTVSLPPLRVRCVSEGGRGHSFKLLDLLERSSKCVSKGGSLWII